MTDLSSEVMASIKSQPANATVAATDGGWTLTMSREFAHPASRVWEMITRPELLQQWSPVVPDRPLTYAGPATSRETPASAPVDAEVLASEAPQLLVHRWGSHTLRWTITPTKQGCRLMLQHLFPNPDERGMYAAGWHICLAVLDVVIGGRSVERVVGARAGDYGWAGLRQEYDALLSA